MNIQLTPQHKRNILKDVREEDLKEELERRAKASKIGRCDHCNKQLGSEPYCSRAYRHEGREPEDWEGLCDTPRVSRDRWSLSYWRDNGDHVTMSRFPGMGFEQHKLRVHEPCDGAGCDDPFCDGGFVDQHIDFGDNLKIKWPEHVKDFGPGGPSKNRGPSPKKPHS